MYALVSEVLSAWRHAERVQGQHDPGSPEHESAVLAAARLKALYAELVSIGVVRAEVEKQEAILDSIRLPRTVEGT